MYMVYFHVYFHGLFWPLLYVEFGGVILFQLCLLLRPELDLLLFVVAYDLLWESVF